MIQINNKKIDLLFQVEQDVSINKLLNGLTIDNNCVMVVCPEIFFSNAIGDLYDYIVDDSFIYDVTPLDTFVEMKIKYKKKEFEFIFFVTPNESKIVNVPLSGNKLFNVGFKRVQL
jgi:hypothetical protein